MAFIFINQVNIILRQPTSTLKKRNLNTRIESFKSLLQTYKVIISPFADYVCWLNLHIVHCIIRQKDTMNHLVILNLNTTTINFIPHFITFDSLVKLLFEQFVSFYMDTFLFIWMLWLGMSWLDLGLYYLGLFVDLQNWLRYLIFLFGAIC